MNQTAYLSNCGRYTSFRFGGEHLRFIGPYSLIGYSRVKTWDHGYLVVDAQYKTTGVVEEYIDLIPVLKNLYMDPEQFLSPIEKVEVRYDENGTDCG